MKSFRELLEGIGFACIIKNEFEVLVAAWTFHLTNEEEVKRWLELIGHAQVR